MGCVASTLRGVAIITGVTLALLLPALVLLEGFAAIQRWDSPGLSLTHRAWLKLTGETAAMPRHQLHEDEEESVASQFLEARYITSEETIEALLPSFMESKVMLGNSPYKKLVSEEARVTSDEPGLGRIIKSDLAFESGYLRSRIFSPVDPISYQIRMHDKSLAKPEALEFIERYGFAPALNRTDEDGYRVTVPMVDSEEVVLVVGDSVGYGIGVADDETLASLLQQRDSSVRYINMCAPGSDYPDNMARLKREIARRGGAIRGLVYIHCENDVERRGPSPAAMAEGIARFVEEAGIDYRIFVAQQYLQRTMPDVFREPNKRDYFADKAAMIDTVAGHRFHIVDTYVVVNDYRTQQRSLLAGAALYVDHCHFSPLGLKLIAKRIPAYSERSGAGEPAAVTGQPR